MCRGNGGGSRADLDELGGSEVAVESGCVRPARRGILASCTTRLSARKSARCRSLSANPNGWNAKPGSGGTSTGTRWGARYGGNSERLAWRLKAKCLPCPEHSPRADAHSAAIGQDRVLTLKRSIDVIGAGVALVLASPIMAVVAVAIRIAMGRPVLYRQERIGKDELPFEVVKFRTMRRAAPDEDELFSDEQRVTGLGRTLRILSLDELPELWLVLTGRMSLVGPRPLLPVYRGLYQGDQRRRHEVRPGLTGLAQISGRQDLTLKERLDRDVEYVQNRSTRLDLAILLRTILLVARRDGVRTGQAIEDIDDIGLADALRHDAEATRG